MNPQNVDLKKKQQQHVREMNENLNDCHRAPKMYQKRLSRFLNEIKISSKPPLWRIVSNFLERAELCNKFFASQCFLVKNFSTLPLFRLQTDKVIDKIKFALVKMIIKKLNPNKLHGCNNIYVRIIKVCDKLLSYPLKLNVEGSFHKGVFPDSWKKANIIPVHKKDTKILLKSYRPISLLPVFVKIFKQLICNGFFHRFITIELFTNCQSGFLLPVSCISQINLYLGITVRGLLFKKN